jgi:hypothetical protein
MRICDNSRVLRAWRAHLHSAAGGAVYVLDNGFGKTAVGIGGGAIGTNLGEHYKREGV